MAACCPVLGLGVVIPHVLFPSAGQIGLCVSIVVFRERGHVSYGSLRRDRVEVDEGEVAIAPEAPFRL